jgi:hypothetical protein
MGSRLGLRRHAPNLTERQADEEVLDMLAARSRMTSSVVARLFECSPERVRIATNRVMQGDLTCSGEPREVVLAGYPWSRA